MPRAIAKSLIIGDSHNMFQTLTMANPHVDKVVYMET